MELAGGIDIVDTCRHQSRLGLTDRGQQRGQLPVDVGGRHHVVVDNRQPAYSGTRQRFGAIRAHAT